VTPVEAAWLSALVDGEGCLDSPRGNPRVRIKMTDHDVVLRAALLMKARTHLELVEGRKPALVAQVTGDKAVAVMEAVLPYLGSRRTAKATEILLTRRLKTPGAAA
jgi:hypothetical protein